MSNIDLLINKFGKKSIDFYIKRFRIELIEKYGENIIGLIDITSSIQKGINTSSFTTNIHSRFLYFKFFNSKEIFCGHLRKSINQEERYIKFFIQVGTKNPNIKKIIIKKYHYEKDMNPIWFLDICFKDVLYGNNHNDDFMWSFNPLNLL